MKSIAAPIVGAAVHTHIYSLIALARAMRCSNCSFGRAFAISHHNRYMVDKADFVVAYVIHSWDGAAQTLEYANQKKKSIIQYK